MNKSDSLALLAKALVKAQSKIDAAKKDTSNPYFKSRYADLSAVIDAIKEPLNTNGISFLQIVGTDNATTFVETTLLHESGEFLSGRTPVLSSKPNDPQAMGSAITYAKRYGLQAMLGLPTVDDDGNAASGKDRMGSTVVAKASIKSDKSFSATGAGLDVDIF